MTDHMVCGQCKWWQPLPDYDLPDCYDSDGEPQAAPVTGDPEQSGECTAPVPRCWERALERCGIYTLDEDLPANSARATECGAFSPEDGP